MGSGNKYIIFSIHEEFFALRLDQIDEVCDLPEIWPIPFVPAYYTGAFNFHGNILPAIDLAHFFEIPVTTNPDKLLVVNHSLASLAFSVTRIVKVVSEEEFSFTQKTEVKFATATIILPEYSATELNLKALVSSAEELIQAYR